jgi:hypothetical protein
MKRCSKCKAEKPLTEFSKDRSGPNGLHSHCKACTSHRYRAWRAANLEKCRENTRAWQRANPEKSRERKRAWHAENRELLKQRKRKTAARDGAGVYSITCTATGEVYVGSTVRGFVGRFSHHRSALACGKHRNKRLQALHDTHGAESLVYQKLAVLEPEMCARTEQALIERTPNCINVYSATARERRSA